MASIAPAIAWDPASAGLVRLTSLRQGYGGAPSGAVPRGGRVHHLEPDDLAADAGGLLLAQPGGADEVVLQPADRPTQVGFERRRRLVDLVPVQAHAGFQPERVAGAEAARNHAGALAGLEERLPDAIGRLRRHEDLEAVLSRVPRARNGRADARHLPMHKPAILHRREIDADERLEDLERLRALKREQRVSRARVDGDRVAGRRDVLSYPRIVFLNVPGVDDE